MNGSPISVPVSRADGWVPGPADLSTSFGGTVYATTPGGTKIAYDRAALMYIRNSPLSKTPTTLPSIPGVTAPDEVLPARVGQMSPSGSKDSFHAPPRGDEDDEDGGVFEMD